MDKFPEAFKRFEKMVNTDNIQSFQQLRLSFNHWAGRSWIGSRKQIEALKVEARRLGLKHIPVAHRLRRRTWRHESIQVRGRFRSVYRDLRTGRFIKKPF